MPEMAARTLRLCLPLQKIPREARLLQEAHQSKFLSAPPGIDADDFLMILSMLAAAMRHEPVDKRRERGERALTHPITHIFPEFQ